MTAPNIMRGVLAPVVTPFKADLSADKDRLIAHCKWLLSQDCGLAVFGTNSEATSLTMDERFELIEALVLDDKPLLDTRKRRDTAHGLVWEFRDRFSEDSHYACFNDETGVYHHVDVEGARPIKRRAYRLSPVEREVARNKIQEMLKDGLIRPSKSEWASPIVIVPKARKILPDKSLGPQQWRFCVDYTGVNKLTKRDP